MTNFDPKAIQEKVGNMVKGTMIDLLPDEQFQALVEKEWKAFFEEPTKKVTISRYNGRFHGNDTLYDVQTSVSPFRNMVWSAMIEEIQPMMTKLLEGDDWKCSIQRLWVDNKEELEIATSDAMQAKFEKHANTMATNMFGDMMAMAVEKMKMEMNQVLASKGIY